MAQAAAASLAKKSSEALLFPPAPLVGAAKEEGGGRVHILLQHGHRSGLLPLSSPAKASASEVDGLV